MRWKGSRCTLIWMQSKNDSLRDNVLRASTSGIPSASEASKNLCEEVDVPYSYILKTFLLSNLKTSVGEQPWRQWQVRHMELGMVSKEAVRDIAVYGRDESRNAPHFVFVDISRHKQCASRQEGWDGSFLDPFACPGEILQRSLVANPCQRHMEILVPCLQIELDTAAGV